MRHTPHPFTVYRNTFTPPMPQAELARVLGVSRSYVNRLEKGEREPGKSLLRTIRAKCGITANELRPDLADVFAEDAA